MSKFLAEVKSLGEYNYRTSLGNKKDKRIE